MKLFSILHHIFTAYNFLQAKFSASLLYTRHFKLYELRTFPVYFFRHHQLMQLDLPSHWSRLLTAVDVCTLCSVWIKTIFSLPQKKLKWQNDRKINLTSGPHDVSQYVIAAKTYHW